MNFTRRGRVRRGIGWLCAGLLGGAALGAGVAPVPGSALPDAWGRAGSTVMLSVPEVAGKPVTVAGTTLPSAGERVTVTIPGRTPPGRLRVQFINDSTQQTITTRDIEVLAPEQPGDPEARRVQLLTSPTLTPVQVDALLARLLPGIGTLNSREQLPAPLGSRPGTTAPGTSPCGGTLAEIQLGAGIRWKRPSTKSRSRAARRCGIPIRSPTGAAVPSVRLCRVRLRAVRSSSSFKALRRR